MPVFEIEGRRLHYLDRGHGTPFVLVHGLGSSGEDLDFQVDAFAADYRLIAPDLRGHGRSDDPPGPYEMQDFAADIWALLDHLGIEQFHLLGYSMGGSIALTMAQQQLDRIKRLILINTQPSYRVSDWGKLRELIIRLIFINLLGIQRMTRMMVHRLFPYPDQQHLRDMVIEGSKKVRSPSYLAALHAIIGFDSLDFLESIDCPTLIIAADQDYFSLQEKEWFVELMPDARMQVIADSRHATPLEKPDEVNQAVLDFLRRDSE